MRYFLAVARKENMTHAAELLHATQSTPSQQIKALENKLGKKLFSRRSRRPYWFSSVYQKVLENKILAVYL